MSGYFKPGSTDPTAGAALGKSENLALGFTVEIRIADLSRFFPDPRHEAALRGTVTSALFGGARPIHDGRFELFSVDPSTGMRRMLYEFGFESAGGESYWLRGQKEISDDTARIDLLEDMTRLCTVIYRGVDASGPIFGAGELYFRLTDGPALAASIKVEGARSWFEEVGAPVSFISFAWGALREEYLKPLQLFYDTGYENLVLSGGLRSAAGAEAPFFFVSGVHDKGFPWGDGELFWDVLLMIGEGSQRRVYAITDRVLEGLELDLARGQYRYCGPLFRLRDGYSASFSQMRRGAAALEALEAEIEIDFEAARRETVAFPFPVVKPLVRKLSSDLGRALTDALPGERPLGIHITPHAVEVRSGRFRLRRPGEALEEWSVQPDGTCGECEHGSFRNLKEPTLLYGYLCALDAEKAQARVQIASRTLRNERTDWPKDQLDRYLGEIVSRTSSAEILLEGDVVTVRTLGEGKDAVPPLRKVGPPVLEVNNDQFPTAIFQRRIVEVEHPLTGRRAYALEEDMSSMRLEAIRSDRAVTVASVRAAEKYAALDGALDAAGFDALLEERLTASGKARSSFLVAIKPNFLFAYDKRDVSTYTDPELVHHLVRRIRQRGFDTIRVVEAQSTYGEFFDRRSVAEMAEYLGFDGSAGYQVVDMTLDADEQRDLGPALGVHPVSKVWREADFRISFAKNKTHAYAYYSLTLKNIYGALPLANKFKEYHCGRGIYATTIEYLRAFPVHFGIIDAWLSADGPFGVFADPAPNRTETVIAGSDLVAVDWVGASKMGIDPMISTYMQLAVEAFGKPAIRLEGDANPYRPWLNVPAVVTVFAEKGMDADHYFGNLLYMIAAQMDETHFRHKNNTPPIRFLRTLTDPLRRTFFVRTGENASALNTFFSRLFYRLGY